MAAATVDYSLVKAAVPYHIQEVRLSALTADQVETITHGGPVDELCSAITWEIVTPPDSPCAMTLMHNVANDSTTNGTADIRFVVAGAGDLTGMVVKVYFHFFHMKSAGIGTQYTTPVT